MVGQVLKFKPDQEMRIYDLENIKEDLQEIQEHMIKPIQQDYENRICTPEQPINELILTFNDVQKQAESLINQLQKNINQVKSQSKGKEPGNLANNPYSLHVAPVLRGFNGLDQVQFVQAEAHVFLP